MVHLLFTAVNKGQQKFLENGQLRMENYQRMEYNIEVFTKLSCSIEERRIRNIN